MSEKEVALLFNFKGGVFSNIFDTGKTQQARPFPSFSHELHANQDHKANKYKVVQLVQLKCVLYRGTH